MGHLEQGHDHAAAPTGPLPPTTGRRARRGVVVVERPWLRWADDGGQREQASGTERLPWASFGFPVSPRLDRPTRLALDAGMIKLGGVAAVAVTIVLAAACSSSTTRGTTAGSAPPQGSTTGAERSFQPKPTSVTVRGLYVIGKRYAIRNNDSPESKCWTMGNSPLFASRTPVDAIRAGAQVVITDAAGTTVGVGTLGGGKVEFAGSNRHHPPCDFRFTIRHVPVKSRYYTIRCGNQHIQATRDQIEGGPRITLS